MSEGHYGYIYIFCLLKSDICFTFKGYYTVTVFDISTEKWIFGMVEAQLLNCV